MISEPYRGALNTYRLSDGSALERRYEREIRKSVEAMYKSFRFKKSAILSKLEER